jgi:hypothetical protein
MVDEQKLRQLAEAAKGWSLDKVQQVQDDLEEGIARVGAENDDGTFAEVVVIDTGMYFAEEQAAVLAHFYAAANPAAILSLLEELQTLREERTAWRVTAENAEAAVKQARIDALEEAKQAVSAEELTEPEDNADDAYNRGVLDCVRAVEKLKGTP